MNIYYDFDIIFYNSNVCFFVVLDFGFICVVIWNCWLINNCGKVLLLIKVFVKGSYFILKVIDF